jgi:bifunctional enzyme CysN/CysC
MAYSDMDLLRFSTAGSVDDGKSTLIGRLLYDSKSIFEDQLEAIEKTSASTGEEGINLALLTDGLRAEREQKITIDVAYRYFATPRRKFIIADTPGHIQYTRNMVTGASTADLTIVLVDARKGLMTQSKRHACIASILQIPHLVVAINKMDLIDYSQERYNDIVRDFEAFAQKLEIDDITFIPMSALHGDNVVQRGNNMPWYNGATLMHTLENVVVGSRQNNIDLRFPVQYVIRPNQDFRGYAGTIASGSIRMGEQITSLPSGLQSTIKEIWKNNTTIEHASAGDAVVLCIEDDIDISRGDMLVRNGNLPNQENEFEALLCWMNEDEMQIGKKYLIQHTTKIASATPVNIRYKLDVETMHREAAVTMQMNDIGRIRLKSSEVLCIDSYKLNNATGSFILIDPSTNATVAAGMVQAFKTNDEAPIQKAETDRSTEQKHSINEAWNIPRTEREKRNKHHAKVLWFTGVSGAGKSTIAQEVEKKLFAAGKQTILLDGDQLRQGMNADLGFSENDRSENIRRVGELAKICYQHGLIVLCTFVSPIRKDRELVRSMFPEGDFIQIYVIASQEVRIQRDPKGLYKKAQAGLIKNLTGYNAEHEAPDAKDAITIDTTDSSLEECVEIILSLNI